MITSSFFSRGGCLQRALAMVVVMFGLGLLPVVGLALVPGQEGPVTRGVVSGMAAVRIFERDMAKSEKTRAAYEESVARLTAMGKKRSATVVAYERREAAPQSVLRRIGEWVVPTLHAATQGYYDYVVFDDWSGYDPAFDGHMEIVSESENRGAALAVGFSKDPGTNFENYYTDIMDYWGFEPEPTSASEGSRGVSLLAHLIRRAVYPTLDAWSLSKSWWDRLHDWATCTVAGCATAATYCWIANVFNAEALWVPCFIPGCGGVEVGCAVLAVIS